MFKRIRWVNPITNFYLENGAMLSIIAIMFIIATIGITIFAIATSMWASLPGSIIIHALELKGVLNYSKVYY